MKTFRFLSFLLTFTFPAALAAQTPEGGVFEVGVASSLTQGADVAMSPQGGFVVAWVRVPPSQGLFARLFAANGSPRTGEIRLRDRRASLVDAVRLAMMDDGSFVAVFDAGTALLARRFSSKGAPLGGEIQVGLGLVAAFEVGTRGDGGFVVTWLGTEGLSVRAFGPAGQPLGAAHQIDPYGVLPQLAVSPEGSFLVIWHQSEDTGDVLVGQFFNADGTPRGDRLSISDRRPDNVFTNFDSAVDSNGDFLATWYEPRRIPASAFVRRYAPDGSPLGGATLLDHRPAGQRIAPGPDGTFVSIWETPGLTPRTQVVVRQSAAGGAPLGPPVVLSPNKYQSFLPAAVLAGNGEGLFVAAWLGKPRGEGNILVVRRFRAE